MMSTKILISKFLSFTTFDRVNWVKTLLLNFMMFPFSKAIKFPVLIYGPCKLSSLKGRIIIDDGVFRKGILQIGMTEPVRSYHSKSFLRIDGDFIIHGEVGLRRGLRLHIDYGAVFEIDDKAYLGDNNTFFVHTYIKIGKGVRMANNNLVMDTDFHYVINTSNGEVRDDKKPIIIDDNCWIGGNCVIKKGAVLPTGTILAGPFSMVSKDYSKTIPEYSIIGGSPAKLIGSGFRRVNNADSQAMLDKYYSENNEVFICNDDIDKFCNPI
ncbi:MAG: acyltransferase [Muribaculaceae bacterium]|nr:acyltransferase [Muribaculaceae bacterium]